MPRRDWLRTIRGSAVCAVCLLASACGGGPALHPVRGQVFFQDKPADGALIVFHPVGGDDDALRPSATVGADGTFRLATKKPDDGAPAGNYVVAVVWYDNTDTKGGAPTAELRNRLPDHYGDANASPLRAQVKPGPNQLEPFRLKK